jgi:hypothetical protein
VATFATSCENSIDTERKVKSLGTLGDDMYGVMCDRLGASSFNEDITGASYRSVCHYDQNGVYGNGVDVSLLPDPPTDVAREARRLSIAKLDRMVQYRDELIAAFNAAFPDIVIPNHTTPDPNDTIRLHDGLLDFSQEITKLYDTNPVEPSGPPLMPSQTQALGRLFNAIETSDGARAAMERISGRLGYRPFDVALGAIRVALSYPALRGMGRAMVQVVAAGGVAAPELQQALATLEAELATAERVVADLEPYRLVDADAAQPNRPRSAIEFASAILLHEHEDFQGPGHQVRPIVARDSRGYAVPAGNVPGQPGTVPPPFTDQNNDGFADVDAHGRHVGPSGESIEPPFFIPDTMGMLPAGADPSDPYSPHLYQFVDTSSTLTAAVARDLIPLVDATKIADDADPEPWNREHETLMYSLAGVHVLAGPRQDALYDYVSDVRVAAGQPCDGCLPYRRFVAEESPFPDMIHAVGQLLAHPDSDAVILGLLELFENHTDVVARTMGVALRIKEIADEHDERAAQGLEPLAELPYEVPVWDEMAQILSEMVETPGLIAGLIDAMADDLIVLPHPQDPLIPGPPVQHHGETMAAFMTYRDQYHYDLNNLNGPAVNISDDPPTLEDPHHPVDRLQPNRGDNRSMWERSMQLIYDTFRVKSCNKDDAKVFLGLGDTYWPLFGSGYGECELFTFENTGAFYLDSMLPLSHPKRALLEIKAADLNDLLSYVTWFAGLDEILHMSSGITGMGEHPTPAALNRLVFFGSYSDQFGQQADYDAVNADTNTAKFINRYYGSGDVRGTLDNLCGPICPINSNGVHHCANVEDVNRVRDYGTIFGWERLGFTHYMMPQAIAFANVGCNESGTQCDRLDYTGENYFGDLISILWRHWPGSDRGDYCDATGSPSTNPRYCSEAGMNRYEPILAEVFAGDLIPSLHAFSKVAAETEITIRRGPRAGEIMTGGEIVEILARVLFSQDYAASVGMTDSVGNTSTTWVDGTPQAQVTPYNMFANSLHRMDLRFMPETLCAGLAGPEYDACAADTQARRSKWKRARSQLTDQFLAVEGQGEASRFANRGVAQTMIQVLKVAREQLNANCPDREQGVPCSWAARDLSRKFSDALSRPAFAALADVMDKLNADEAARRETERFLTYALTEGTGGEALQGLLASLSDIVQLITADGDLSEILRAASTAASPGADPEGAGVADRTVQVLHALTGDAYDRYHVLDYVLPSLVTPMSSHRGLTPIEVIVNAVADINRDDATQTTPLTAADYRTVFRTVKEFFTSRTRGFEQLYHIVQNRPLE